MRKVMVIQHVGHEPLGTLNPMLKAAGLRLRYVNFGRHPDLQPKLDGYSGLVVLGGPMGVYDAERLPHLKVEMQVLEEALKREIPILGICLGAQLMAHVLGASVAKAPKFEAGWTDVHLTADGAGDPLLKNFAKSEKVFQLHQDTFQIPRGAVHLAESDLLTGQAFRYGKKAYGLQFHLESDHAMIERWLRRPEYRHFFPDVPAVQNATQVHMARATDLGRITFNSFIDLFELPPKSKGLGSDHGGR
jgi:GMP synthase (glutamine-hydrolysing)